MRNHLSSRFGLMSVGLMIMASLDPAAPPFLNPQVTAAQANADAIRVAVQAKIKAATSLLEQAREALDAHPAAVKASDTHDQIRYWLKN